MSSIDPGGAAGNVRVVLRAEGAALLGAALLLYAQSGASWKMFLIFFLAPDLSFAFYIAGTRVGAFAYNIMHSTIGPFALALASQCHLAPPPYQPMLLPLALIWFAHVGFDRALGYGLKYASGFSDTHLGFIGRKRHQTA
jgi:Domain of unknown function (DUF4260)